MEKASHTLQRIMLDALRRMPAAELPSAAWDFAAGQKVAEKTRVVSYADGILTVEVPDVRWRAQLQSMAPQFLSRMAELVKVERIEFAVKGGVEPERNPLRNKSTQFKRRNA
jgi:predicted nucleic acid-binding Zn ribbon protein